MPKNRNVDIASHTLAIKRNPSSKHPWARNVESANNHFVWIHINARQILDQQSKGAGRVRVKPGPPEVQYAFLAPLAITEQAVHNWAEYDSIASRLAQKIRTAAKIGAEFEGIVGAFEGQTEKNNKTRDLLKNNAPNKAQSIANILEKGYNNLASHSIQKKKVDTPLYYENSNRRSFTFEVILVAEKSPRYDVVEPVKDLMKWSSPALRGGITIDFPYMFEVYTRPKEFIRFSTLALTAVQPTYNAPYIGGYPSSCNLQLTFLDMSPLYRNAIETGSVINVIGRGATGTSGKQSIGSGTEENDQPIIDPIDVWTPGALSHKGRGNFYKDQPLTDEAQQIREMLGDNAAVPVSQTQTRGGA